MQTSTRPWPKRELILLTGDCLVLFGTIFVAGLLRVWAGGYIDPGVHASLFFVLLISPLFNYFQGLYGPTPPSLPEELHLLAVSTSLAYFCIAIFLFLTREDLPSRLVYVASWLSTLALLPLMRCGLRHFFQKYHWWGVPVVLFGQGELIPRLQSYLQQNFRSGLRPKAIYAPTEAMEAIARPATTQSMLANASVPCIPNIPALQAFVKANPTAVGLVIMAKDAESHRQMLKLTSQLFATVILVPEDFADAQIPCWVRPFELGHLLCLRVRQNLFDPRRLALKRLMDLVFCLSGSLVLLPIFGLIALLISLESKGSPFFSQLRIGRHAKPIRILKFRTMVNNAEEVLQKYLAKNPEMAKEWAETQKLRYDPRITRIGRFLRHTSLDELPQIWNVILGDMSLVGPRPIVNDEITRYGDDFAMYIRVRPGITGLWQVSGRNDLSYQERVYIDRYYISNWSTWLDLIILAKTIPVVLLRKGAY